MQMCAYMVCLCARTPYLAMARVGDVDRSLNGCGRDSQTEFSKLGFSARKWQWMDGLTVGHPERKTTGHRSKGKHTLVWRRMIQRCWFYGLVRQNVLVNTAGWQEHAHTQVKARTRHQDDEHPCRQLFGGKYHQFAHEA